MPAGKIVVEAREAEEAVFKLRDYVKVKARFELDWEKKKG